MSVDISHLVTSQAPWNCCAWFPSFGYPILLSRKPLVQVKAPSEASSFGIQPRATFLNVWNFFKYVYYIKYRLARGASPSKYHDGVTRFLRHFQKAVEGLKMAVRGYKVAIRCGITVAT